MLYQQSRFWPALAPTQEKFTVNVSAFFSRAAAVPLFGMMVATARDDQHEGKVSGGVRVWRFKTQRLRSVLLEDHPSLEDCKSRA